MSYANKLLRTGLVPLVALASGLLLSGCVMDNGDGRPVPDRDNDGVADDLDICDGFDDTVDTDGDGVPNGCDTCASGDDAQDSDEDSVPDACDVCPGSDDRMDMDDDGTPDGCDVCAEFADGDDADGDGVPDGCDVCRGFDDGEDADGDGTPDGCDMEQALARDDLTAFATFASGTNQGAAVDLRNLQVGDQVTFTAPSQASLLRQVADDQCTCEWSVEPAGVGTFDPVDECTTVYTVEGTGDAVITTVITCGEEQFGLAQGVSAASALGVGDADPQVFVMPIPSDDCTEEGFDGCVGEGTIVQLDASASIGGGFLWAQVDDDIELGRPDDPALASDALGDPPVVADDVENVNELAAVRFEAPAVPCPQNNTREVEFTLTMTLDSEGAPLDEPVVTSVLIEVSNTDNCAPPPPPPAAPTDPCAGVVCNDNEPCTTDQCVDGACVFTDLADGSNCSDGNPCTINDECTDGVCGGDDAANGTACDLDGDFCTADTCMGGVCEMGGDPCEAVGLVCNEAADACQCDDNADCAGLPNDGNDCTEDMAECVGGMCEFPNLAEGSACGDPTDNPCNAADTCDGLGFCQPNLSAGGTPCGNPANTECNNPDSCDGAGNCLDNFAAEGTSCGEQVATNCSAPDQCDGAGTCDPRHFPNGLSCSDGLFCNGSEQCDGNGVCDAGTSPCTDPGTPVCDEDANACVECLDNDDCPPDETCNTFTNTCEAGLAVTGTIFRGDHDGTDQCDGGGCTSTGAANGTDASGSNGRSFAIEVVDDASNPLGTAVIDMNTADGTFSLTVPFTDFDGVEPNRTFTGSIIVKDAAADAPADPNVNVRSDGIALNAIAEDGNYSNLELVVFFDHHVATTGDNGNNGTVGAPVSEIENAVDDALPGDHVVVHPGEYFERVDVTVSGTAERPIVIRSQNWAPNVAHERSIDVTIDADNVNSRAIEIVGQEYVIFRGFIIENAAGANGKNMFIANSQFITAEDIWTRFTDGFGIDVSGSQGNNNITIRRCVCQQVGNIGIRLGNNSASQPFGVTDSLVEDCDSFGNGFVNTENANGFWTGSHESIPVNQKTARNIFRRCIAYNNISANFSLLDAVDCIYEDNVAWRTTTQDDADGRGMVMGLHETGGGVIVRRCVSYDSPRAGLYITNHPDAVVYNSTFFENGFQRPGENPPANKQGLFAGGADGRYRNVCTFDNDMDFNGDPDPNSPDLKIAGGGQGTTDNDFNLVKDDNVVGGALGPNSLTGDPQVVDKDLAKQLFDDYSNGLIEREAFLAQFADALRPAPGSPLIDAGDFVVFTSAAGNNTTSISVDGGSAGAIDARRYFRAGEAIQVDDQDGVAGTAQEAIVVSVTNDTIVVDTPLTFPDNAGVHVDYNGNKPDIGAYESQ